ncbi:hypothetical protein KCU73_g177, partial [Aureobasidium melanogenum]
MTQPHHAKPGRSLSRIYTSLVEEARPSYRSIDNQERHLSQPHREWARAISLLSKLSDQTSKSRGHKLETYPIPHAPPVTIAVLPCRSGMLSGDWKMGKFGVGRGRDKAIGQDRETCLVHERAGEPTIPHKHTIVNNDGGGSTPLSHFGGSSSSYNFPGCRSSDHVAFGKNCVGMLARLLDTSLIFRKHSGFVETPMTSCIPRTLKLFRFLQNDYQARMIGHKVAPNLFFHAVAPKLTRKPAAIAENSMLVTFACRRLRVTAARLTLAEKTCA